jgi:antitoxin HigA-1
MRMHNPPHVGEVLRDYLGSLSVIDAGKHLGLTRAALSRILNGGAGISADVALRVSEALGTSAELWIGMQAQYNFWQASKRHRAQVPRLDSLRHVILGSVTETAVYSCRQAPVAPRTHFPGNRATAVEF